MDCIDFANFVNRVIERLKEVASLNPQFITSCRSGDDFELCVVDIVNGVLNESSLDAKVHHTPGSHAFPDIIIEFDSGIKYGLEVKSSSSAKSKGWKINGNSVMGSTRDDSVIETYIIFGKTARTNLDFRARKYDECVANVVVTHSPRYLIDMDVPIGETFFDKSGIEYQDIISSENPIGLITSYFQKQGQKAWWLAESTPAAVRLFSDISAKEQFECFGYGLAHFPELFERNSTKYKRLAMWMATERSIVSPSLRDDFTAGGQVDIILNGTIYSKLPQIFSRLIEYKGFLIKSLEDASPESLCADWGINIQEWETVDDRVRTWISVVASHICVRQLPEGIKPLNLLYDIFPEYRK